MDELISFYDFDKSEETSINRRLRIAWIFFIFVVLIYLLLKFSPVLTFSHRLSGKADG